MADESDAEGRKEVGAVFARSEIDQPYTMQRLFLTIPEIEVLLLAMAKSVDPDAEPKNPTESSKVVWDNHDKAGRMLCSLATMLVEATY